MDDELNAIRLFNEGMFAEAARLFEKCLDGRYSGEKHLHLQVNLGTALQKAGRCEEARRLLEEVIQFSSGIPNVHNNLGVVYKQLGMFEEAREQYRIALNLEPTCADAHFNLGNIYWTLQAYDEATICFERTLSVSAGHKCATKMLQAISGDSHSDFDADYVEELFDNYASEFEASLCQLGYKTPSRFYEILKKIMPKAEISDVLDLGCGTGLVATAFKDCYRSIVGVDISKKMLEKAKEKNCYAELHQSEVIDFLRKDSRSFGMIICADVLIYMKNLQEFFMSVVSHLESEGLLLFSTEGAASGDFEVKKSGRFGHSGSYIQRELAKVGLEVVFSEICRIRFEQGEAIEGAHYIVRKATALYIDKSKSYEKEYSS